MRIARFTTDEDPRFGLVGEDDGRPMIAVVAGDPLYAGISLTGEKVPLDDVRLLAPVIPRSKVLGIGKNYAAHAAEMGGEAPTTPLVFVKPNTSVVGPGDPIVLPAGSTEVHHEGELAVVIGRICKDVSPDDAAKVIFGYTIANDVTERAFQRDDGQWWRAKGSDTFCPLGPWIETNLDPSDVSIRTLVGDDVRQDGRTSDMIHKIPDLVAHVSAAMTLLPGDVILTGTPEGVGPLTPGDEVSVTIEGIGTLTNRVVPSE
ncbi:fumarylacetoacetate hydrolase family protein [Solicola sp. PLA-1-18]|uniref:fumarylacetoacetate hydrolase family protein n=1 Tax=Solicola sp. PLA-1-18 TaxID=3380532 RepID=UPI003B7826E5